MDGASAAGKFFILRSSLTKAKIVALLRAAKNRVSVTSKNLLTKSGFRVNKNNALIFNAKTDVFVREKHCFPFCGAARAFLLLMCCRFSVGSFLHRMGVYVFRAAVYSVRKVSIGSGDMG